MNDINYNKHITKNSVLGQIILDLSITIILFIIGIIGLFTSINTLANIKLINQFYSNDVSEKTVIPIDNYNSSIYKYLKKVAIIVSYYLNDPSSQPLKMGFTDNIQSIENKYYWWMEGFYMRTKLINKSQHEINRQARYIIKDVENNIKPDVIITVDDDAFIYVGGPLSKKHYKVFALGLNNNVNYYNGLFNKNNTIMMFKTPDYKGLKNILIKTNTIDYFSKIYIISSYLPTKSEIYNIRQFKKTFNKILPIEIVRFKTTIELANWIKKNNKSNDRYIYILAIQRCYNPYNSELVNELKIAKIISKYNIKHLEISTNPILSKYSGIMLSYGPDYIKMGKQLCYLIKEYINNKKIKNNIIYFSSELVINIDKFKKDLILNTIYNNLYPYIYKIY